MSNGIAPGTAATRSFRYRRGPWGWRRANRRITVESRSLAVWIGERLAALGRRLLVVAKVVAAVAVLAGALEAGRLGVTHVVASPRFSLSEIRVGPTVHVSRDDIVARSGVSLGSRLLALDTDQIAARLARHPWIAAARVRRELPGALVIDVTERNAAAVAVIGGLYLLDERGHPFKHATLEEADGHVVVTGISRAEYAGLPRASEAAFREALALEAAYLQAAYRGGSDGPTAVGRQDREGSQAAPRPALSEVHIDPHTGFSLFLYEGGAQIRLGRGDVAAKLARFDAILAEFGPRRFATLRTVYLDGAAGDRVPIRLAPVAEAAPPPGNPGK